MSRYLPLCSYIDKTFDFLPAGSGVLASVAGTTGLSYGLHKAFNVASNDTWVFPAMAGFLLAGGFVEKHVPPMLRSYGVGLKKGGMILRGAQLAAVSLPLAISLAIHFNIAAENMDAENRPPEPLIPAHTLSAD